MKKRSILFVAALAFAVVFAQGQNVAAAKLPEKYRSKEETSVKNQNKTDLCWVYSSVSAMEMELLKNNDAESDIDFSEVQLAYFFINPALDELGQSKVLLSGRNDYNTGGDATELIATLACGVSPVDQSEVEITKDGTMVDTSLDDSLAYTGAYYLKEGWILKGESNDVIKEAVMEYGAVVTSYYSSNRTNFNKETYGWYNPDATFSDHAVCIVGWDDTYSKENFVKQPEGDGAWIVKNSWGADWGDEGYFYLSYYEPTIKMADNAVFDMEVGKAADHIYQNVFTSNGGRTMINGKEYYGNVIGRGSGREKVANVFTVLGNEAGAEELKAVSLLSLEPGTYEIKIYKNVKENINPESGTLATTLKGKLEYAGFSMIPLKKPVYLSEGESFSVVVDMRNEEGKFIGVNIGGGCTDIAEMTTLGQSFVFQDKKWIDLAESAGAPHNLWIKAYTDDIEADVKADAKAVKMKVTLPTKITNRPADVTNVTKVFAEGESVVLSWDEVACDCYVIYQYNKTSDTWKKVGDTDKCYFTVTGLSGGTEYTFGVTSVAKKKSEERVIYPYRESCDKEEITVKTVKTKKVTTTVKPGANGVTVSWNKVSGATKYEVYVMSPGTEYEWELLKTLKSSEKRKYTDKGALIGLTHSYRVIAYKGDKVLGKSTPVSVFFEK